VGSEGQTGNRKQRISEPF